MEVSELRFSSHFQVSCSTRLSYEFHYPELSLKNTFLPVRSVFRTSVRLDRVVTPRQESLVKEGSILPWPVLGSSVFF